MTGAKLLLLFGVPLAAACAAIGWSRRFESARARAALITVLALLVAVAFWTHSASRLRHFGDPGQLATWGVYHYYLGAKYFDELGFTGLYEQTLAADAEGERRLAGIKRLRNLETYRKEEIEDPGAFRRSASFSDARWQEFKSDVRYLLGCREPGFWDDVLIDRGYNASPAWHVFGGTLVGLLSIQQPWSQTLLVLLDVVLILLAFGASVRAYGWARSLLVLVAFLLWFGNTQRLFGQLYVLDWFAACWGAISAWRLGRERTAGALLAYAAMVRLFPMALFLGPVFHAGFGFVRGRRLDPRYRRFFLAALVCAAALFVLGGVHTRHGFRAWTMFASEIATHSEHHIEGERRLGLKHAFTVDFLGGWPEEFSKKRNAKNAGRNEPVFRVVQLAMLAVLLLAIRRADAHDSMLLGAVLVFIAMVSSRYYGSVYVFLLLVGCGSRGAPSADQALGPFAGRKRASLVFDGLFFLLIWLVHAAEAAGANRYAQYLLANALLFAWLCALTATRAFAGKRAPLPDPGVRIE